MKRKQLIGNLMLLLAAMLWGGTYAIQSLMSKSIGTFTIVFLKTINGFFILGYCYIKKKQLRKKAILAGIIVGVIGAIGLICQQMGIGLTSVSKASFISGLYVMFVPLLGLFTRKKPKPRFWLAIFISFIGMYLLCMSGNEKFGIGDLVVLISAVFFAEQIILIDKFSEEVDNVLAFCGVQQITICIISSIPVFILEKPQLNDFNGLLLPILYVMFLSGMIAQIIQNKYQNSVEPTTASLIMSLESVFGALFGWLLLKQTLTFKEIIGCILMFIAIMVAE